MRLNWNAAQDVFTFAMLLFLFIISPFFSYDEARMIFLCCKYTQIYKDFGIIFKQKAVVGRFFSYGYSEQPSVCVGAGYLSLPRWKIAPQAAASFERLFRSPVCFVKRKSRRVNPEFFSREPNPNQRLVVHIVGGRIA